MKTKIILLFLTHLSTYYFSFSQTSEHLTFKGIPIDGTLKEYVSKMTQNGFSNLNTDDGKILLNGDFAGYTNCKVRVIELKQKDLVHKIDVKFPDLQTWSTLSGNYFELKDMLTDKYGNATEIVERFDSYTQNIDDNNKMIKVKLDNCKYFSIWKTDKGDIHLSIQHQGMSSCYVTLLYSDKINSEIMKAIAKRDL